MNSFEVLLSVINAAIKALNDNGYHIRDDINPEYYITSVYYCPHLDEIYFEAKEG